MFWTRPAAWYRVPTAVVTWSCGLRPRAVELLHDVVAHAVVVADPIGCGRTAIASTCRIARSDENTVSGAVAGTGDGGRVTRRTEMAHSTASPNAVATRVTMLSFMRSLRLTVEASFYY
jgi:hypothetical protein